MTNCSYSSTDLVHTETRQHSNRLAAISVCEHVCPFVLVCVNMCPFMLVCVNMCDPSC